MKWFKRASQQTKALWDEYGVVTIATILFLIVIAGLLPGCQKEEDTRQVPPPEKLRTDILYGYYGSSGEQPRETRDHINLHFDTYFRGTQYAIDSLRYMQMTAVVSVMPQLFEAKTPFNYRLRLNSEDRVRAYLKELHDADVLKYIVYIYPVDEPDFNNVPVAEVLEACRIVRKVAAEFSLKPRLLIFYGPNSDWRGSEAFDVIGFDDYYAKASIFFNGQYAALKAVKKPYQRLALIPGGAGPWETDPVSFYNMAHRDPDVEILMPFSWVGPDGPESGFTSGIGTNSRRADYCRTGKLLTGKAGGC